jgi:hypothetical protein
MQKEKRAINPNPEISVLWERICICSSLIEAGVEPLLAKNIADQGYRDAIYFWKNSKFSGDPSYRLRRWTRKLLREHSISARINVDNEAIIPLLARIAQPTLAEDSRLALLIFLLTPTSFSKHDLQSLPQKQWEQQFGLGVRILKQGRQYFNEPKLSSICTTLMFFYHYAGIIGGKSYRDFVRQLTGTIYYKYPDSSSTLSLQAWMMFRKSREPARTLDGDLRSENRSLWNQDYFQQGNKYLNKIPKSDRGVIWLHAQIEQCYLKSPTWEGTNWVQLVKLYHLLEKIEPRVSVLIPYAESISMRDGPDAGLALLDSKTYGMSDPAWLALRGELLYRTGRSREGLCNFQRALRKASDSFRPNLLHRMASCQQTEAFFGA